MSGGPQVTTLGVEEEYLLVDPVTGHPVPAADAVLTAADLGSLVDPGEVQPELLRAQLEVATPVCETLDEVGAHLLRLRHAVAAAAEGARCRIVASGTSPFAGPDHAEITDAPRYRALRVHAPQLAHEQWINGMHVHVAVPDPDAGVAVLNRIRCWLPLLVGLSVNSPLWQGADTGFASWRTVVAGRWAVGGIPPVFADGADYRRRVGDLVRCGALRDHGGVYWQARLSERYPTVEVRAADVQMRVDEAVMIAGIVRALVLTALDEHRADAPWHRPHSELLTAANWHAARHGTTGALIDPFGARTVRAGDLIGRLVEHVTPALRETGDLRQVTSLAHRLLRSGTGADRQRRAWRQGGSAALLRMLTAETVALG